MKNHIIEFESKFEVGDKVIGIDNKELVRGTVEEIYIGLDEQRFKSIHTVTEKPKILIRYKIKVSFGEFATTYLLPESALASSLEEFYIHGN